MILHTFRPESARELILVGIVLRRFPEPTRSSEQGMREGGVVSGPG